MFLLDAALHHAALGGREAVLTQIRLAWWRDELVRLGERSATRPHPALQHLAQHSPGYPGPSTALVDAWEELATGEDFQAGAEEVATARGGALAAIVRLDEGADCLAAARRWSLVELAALAPGAAPRGAMLQAAASIAPVRLPPALRPLAVLDGLARRALKRGGGALIGDRLSPLAAMRLGIFGR